MLYSIRIEWILFSEAFTSGLRLLELPYFQVFFFRQNFELKSVKNLAVSQFAY